MPPNRPGPLGGLDLAGWSAALRKGQLAGSLFAVEAGRRLEAARLLDARGHRIHVDVILTNSGGQRGVSLGCLQAVREECPSAELDVHIIVPPGPVDVPVLDAVRTAVNVAGRAGVTLIAMPNDLASLPGLAVVIDHYRESGGKVWAEVSPGDDGPVSDCTDGALVMLIPPGTLEDADPSLLDRVPAFRERVPVGVDGGVTEGIARKALAAGASHVVAGRSLFRHKDLPSSQEMRKEATK